MERLKYVACFAVSIVSALATYRAFFLFKSDAVFSPSVPFINTVVLMLIWAISFSAKSEFVRRNKILLIAIPLISVQFSNLIMHLNNSATSQLGFIFYVVTSTSLVLSSYHSSIIESRIS